VCVFVAPNLAAASSYSAGDDGVSSVVSGSVANSQTASCWVVITNNGHTAFTSNSGSGTISSYELTSNDGTLTLVNSVAGDTGANSAPIDCLIFHWGHRLDVGSCKRFASQRHDLIRLKLICDDLTHSPFVTWLGFGA